MPETSPTTSPEGTAGTPTPPTAEPSSTTPPASPAPETPPSNGKTEPSVLNTPPAEPKPGDAKPEGAPDKYADYKIPEGYKLDADAAKGANELFKSLNLSQDSAQKLIDYYFAQAIKSSDASRQSVKDMRDGWLGELRNDPEFKAEFKADGNIREDSKVLVGLGRMLDSLGDKKLATDFRTAMDITGAGNNPAFFRVMYRLSQHFAEGTPVRSGNPSPFGQPGVNGQPTGQRPSLSRSIYPNLP